MRAVIGRGLSLVAEVLDSAAVGIDAIAEMMSGAPLEWCNTVRQRLELHDAQLERLVEVGRDARGQIDSLGRYLTAVVERLNGIDGIPGHPPSPRILAIIGRLEQLEHGDRAGTVDAVLSQLEGVGRRLEELERLEKLGRERLERLEQRAALTAGPAAYLGTCHAEGCERRATGRHIGTGAAWCREHGGL
jgi:hypothetical protein